MRLLRDSHTSSSQEEFPDASQFGGLASFYDELMMNVPYEQWADYVMELFELVKYTPIRTLDCACGTGNITFALAKRGLEMYGVDISHEMLDVARDKAQHITTQWPVRFGQGDLSDFGLGETFTAATCLYDSLNYIIDPARLERAFKCINNHLVPGGVFVFDLNSEFALSADLFTQRNTDPRQNLHYDWQATYDEEARVCTVNMIFEHKDPAGRILRFYERHSERAYSIEEITGMLARTGWELLHNFDAYTLNAPGERSERWFFVARKV